jgi:hypothetical protein
MGIAQTLLVSIQTSFPNYLFINQVRTNKRNSMPYCNAEQDARVKSVLQINPQAKVFRQYHL